MLKRDCRNQICGLLVEIGPFLPRAMAYGGSLGGGGRLSSRRALPRLRAFQSLPEKYAMPAMTCQLLLVLRSCGAFGHCSIHRRGCRRRLAWDPRKARNQLGRSKSRRPGLFCNLFSFRTQFKRPKPLKSPEPFGFRCSLGFLALYLLVLRAVLSRKA